MLLYVLVGLAGMAGALLRYGVGLGVEQIWGGSYMLSTFLINMVGSFALGYLTFRLARFSSVHPNILVIFGTGLIGSFTTFSTFSVENIQLIQSGHVFTAVYYSLLSLAGGLVMSWIGFRLGSNKRSEERGRL